MKLTGSKCSGAGPLLPKAVGDANANVMDKALEALGAFLEKANEDQAARWGGAGMGCCCSGADVACHCHPALGVPAAICCTTS